MPRWEYCYAAESLEFEGEGVVHDYFIARPDGPETRRDIRPNELLAILGSEEWELVSVVGVETKYSERRASIGHQPHPSAMQGTSNTSSTVYYFKRPRAD
jgi:hypothetical protein